MAYIAHMHLIAFSVEGYRRFIEKTSVKLHGRLVAFVGPNEAGKSSLLQAMAHLDNTTPFAQNEKPRRTTVEPKLTWHLQLDAEDKDLIKDIPDSAHIDRAVVIKRTDGGKEWGFEPRNPSRDKSKRIATAQLLQTNRSVDLLTQADGQGESPFNYAQYDAVHDLLTTKTEDYTNDQIQRISALAEILRGLSYPAGDDGMVDEDKGLAYQFCAQAADLLSEIAVDESKPSPCRMVIDQLKDRLPGIVFFREDDRNLSSQYDLTEVAASPPRALMHLAFLADLDLKALLDEVNSNAIADVATRRNAANRKLLTVFDQSWNQQGIAIQVDVQGRILHIQATTPEDSGLSDIAERSDGMRWFAALLAFSYGWGGRPILLVDEIETHLHYDAQADLINVLSNQSFISKVIYTTHSFGCLPNDLGTGVRVVQPIDAARSRLENGFWKQGAGFSPLLASMGAAAMSFTPTRRALIAEGPSDAILLPALLRQACNKDDLGFHVAPGISSVAAIAVPGLDTEAGRVGFIVDGDDGGKELVSKLQNGGIDESRIIALPDAQSGGPLETEDLVDIDIYVNAVNDEIRCWNEMIVYCTAGDVGDSCRTKMLESWCEEHSYSIPDKTAVAQRIVDLSADRDVFAATSQELLQRIFDQARSILGLA